MTELEQALHDLGGWVEYPPTPNIAAAAGRRLAAEPRPGRRLVQRRLVLALALLAVAVGAVFAVPSARTAILEFLGLKGVTIERVVTLPQVPEAADLALGLPTTLEGVRERGAFPVLVPERLGDPDAVYVAADAAGGRVSLVYLPDEQLPQAGETGVGLLLTEFRGTLEPALIGKLVAGRTSAEEVTVDGEPGLWIEGEAHEVFYRAPDGEVVADTLRLAGNTLLWEHDGLLLRIEAQVPKEEALRIAASLR